ncbi:hypothetical protein BVY04_02675 [bacterium M21]|nr:hypothetical protein BVY04_02675 [bacterium M21]
MDQNSATRMNLMARKGQLKLAAQGSKLLQSKREALLKELLSLVKPLIDAHSGFAEKLPQAAKSLAFAEGMDGKKYLKSLGSSAGGRIEVDVAEEKFWGVRIPAVGKVERETDELDKVAPGATGRGLETGRDFTAVTEALLAIIPLQIRLNKLGEEVQKTSRRVNALDQVLIPGIEHDIKSISQTLEEMEREDTFRLRRIKKKRENS